MNERSLGSATGSVHWQYIDGYRSRGIVPIAQLSHGLHRAIGLGKFTHPARLIVIIDPDNLPQLP